MSEYYYKNVKCVRGGGYSGHIPKYTMKLFNDFDPDYSIIDDNELKIICKNKLYNYF
jgi:hypothetical protein